MLLMALCDTEKGDKKRKGVGRGEREQGEETLKRGKGGKGERGKGGKGKGGKEN